MTCANHPTRLTKLSLLFLSFPRGVRPASRGISSVSSVFTAALSLWLMSALAPARAVTLSELRADPKLTPERFMKHFADFKFRLGRTVRRPETFLTSKVGDCDDFATLAADVLRQKGYTPHLVAVFMPHEVHVVCYVVETRSYLDFNRRAQSFPLVSSTGALDCIARSVAESFRTDWRSVSEFTYANGTRTLVQSEFH